MEHNQSLRLIVRHSEPNKLDTADYGTLCRSYFDLPYDYSCYYLQVSSNAEKPKWEKIGCLESTDGEEVLLKLIELLK